MAKKRRTSKKRRSTRKSAPKRAARPRKVEEDKSGMWVAAIIAVVAVVGLILLYTESQPTGQVSFEQLPGGLSEAEQTGWDLGPQVAAQWDGTEMREFCSRNCGNACAQAVDRMGNDRGNCYESCRQNCETQILKNWGTDPNAAAY